MTSYVRTRRGLMMALPGLALLGAARAQAQQAEYQTPAGSEAGPPLVTYELDSWVDAWGRPTAKVMINGEGPFDFMVDTGSTTTVIARRHIERVGATLVGTTMVYGTTGAAEMPIAHLERIETGVVTKKNVVVAVIPDKGLAREDGILGADVFAGKRLIFDIPGKSVKVETPYRRPHSFLRSNMTLRNGTLAQIDGRIGKVRARFMLDTGGQKCIVNPRLDRMLRQAHPRMLTYDSARIVGVTGHELIGSYLSLPQIDMGIVKVTDTIAIAADAPVFKVWGLENEPAMIVGVELLSRLAGFSIDYGARFFDAYVLSMMATNRAMMG